MPKLRVPRTTFSAVTTPPRERSQPAGSVASGSVDSKRTRCLGRSDQRLWSPEKLRAITRNGSRRCPRRSCSSSPTVRPVRAVKAGAGSRTARREKSRQFRRVVGMSRDVELEDQCEELWTSHALPCEPSGICEGAGLVKDVWTCAFGAWWTAGVRGWCCVVPHQGVVLSCAARLPGICPPRRAWCGRATTRKDSISSSTSPGVWESCRFRVAWGRVRASRGGPLLEAADLAIAEAVVDEGHQSAGGRDAGLVGAASFRDPMEVVA
jgi:hypothetical protein